MSSKTKSTETKSTETNRKNFIWFNGIIISIVVIFGILAKRAPYNILTIKSKTVLKTYKQECVYIIGAVVHYSLETFRDLLDVALKSMEAVFDADFAYG